MRLEDEIKQSKFESEWHKTSINLVFTYHWAKEKMQLFLKDFDITMQQFNVLRILRGQHPNPVSACDIRERLLDRMSDTPRIVERLCKEGLAQKTVSEVDKRYVDVLITKKGLALLRQIDEAFPELMTDYQRLSQEEAVVLNMLLDKLRG
jgi:DNA-binding MarR family transcriptional regulator